MPPSPPLCKFPYNVNAALPQCRTAAHKKMIQGRDISPS